MKTNPWVDIPLSEDAANVRRINAKHPLNLFWGKDYLGRYLFIFRSKINLNKVRVNLPELSGVEVSLTKDGQQAVFVLVLKEHERWELFLALCDDLVEASWDVSRDYDGLVVFENRLKCWHDFWKKAKSRILSTEQIKGLVGELLFLKNWLLPYFNADSSIAFWTAPRATVQDFSVREVAVEVKCQVGTTSPKVTISSPEQLYPQLSELLLFVVTLGKSGPEYENAVNLPKLIGEIRNSLETESVHAVATFDDLLLEVGYMYSKEYENYSYVVVDSNFYRVEDPFPRLSRDDIPRGVENLTYSVLLSECDDFKVEPSWCR